jgi:D-alanyl-lipoteichoic acid acyltransferase DltB (MBOAT superfamily)
VPDEDGSGGRGFLWLGIAVNVAVLGYLKYNDFFLPELQDLLNTETGSLRILLPIGLSFFMVQAISYLMDVRRKLLEPVRDLPDFALYMVYFPKLTAGPIERARDFVPRLQTQRIVDNDLLTRSFALVMIGLVRKVAIADVITSITPDDIFTAPGEHSAPELLIWLVAYGFALYNDFAGYTSIVRGVSGFFGIEISSNFNTPYLARNFTEFWQRWHITLSDWLRDYIFSPLLRGLLRRKYNSRHILTMVLPPMVTMFVSALWHDVSLNMLLWGGIHGVYQVFERIRAVRAPSKPPQQHPAWRQVAAMSLVFVLAVIAWVPFRMEIGTALDYWQMLFSPNRWANVADFTLLHRFHVIVGILILITLTMDIVQYRKGELAVINWQPLPKAILINIAIFGIILATAAQGDAPPQFIYQGF